VYNPTVKIYPEPGNSTSGAGFSASAVVSPLGGHGSNAPRELGANKVMIRMLLKGDEGGDFDVVNDYRQFSIIKNPEFSGFSAGISAGTRAGSLNKERTVLDIKNPNNVCIVDFPNKDSDDQVVVYNQDDFSIGEKICQGNFNNNQPRGSVVGWTGSIALGVLTVSVTNGQFRSTASSEGTIGTGTGGKIVKGETSGSVYTGGSGGFIRSVTNERSFYNRSFIENDVVLGMNSRATGKVVSFLSDSVGETGKLTIDGLVGDFIGPKVSLGTLVDGEKIFGFRSLDTNNGTVSVSGSPVGVISKVNNEPVNIDLTNRLTTKIKTYFSDSNFIITGQELDQSIVGSSGGASAFIVNAKYTIGNTSGGVAGSTVDIITTTNKKTFQVGESVTLNSKTGIIRSIEEPEFSRYSGEVLYIENVRPVQRNADQEEEIKLVIDF